jgi:23S rRNA pseudouridine1911/1915/1917 synthase
MKLTYTISMNENLKTVKYILKSKLMLSERLVKKLKFAGKIYRNSIPVHINAPVEPGDIIEVNIEFNEINEDIIPEYMALEILYEDDSIIALNKPPNIVVHPTSSHFNGTMANGVMHYLLNKGIKTRIRPVSRLDRDTSGIIVFALNQYIQERLINQMHSNAYYKQYAGIVSGVMEQNSGTIDLPIDRKPDSIMLRHISQYGAPSVTHYKVIERLNDATFMHFVLETGRTHQIRVHCQAIGHPLIGDTLYPYLGKSDALQHHETTISRQALHSFKTIFTHPVKNTLLELTAPIPEDIMQALEILRK